MSLSGNLADLPLHDIFQIVAMSKKSGVLRVTAGEEQTGSIVFSGGQIVAAWNTRSPQIITNTMAAWGDAENPRAIILPDRTDPPIAIDSALSTIATDSEDKQHLLEAFTLNVLYDLVGWGEGTFLFELRGNQPDEMRIPEEWLWVPQGIDPTMVALEGARLGDEGKGEAYPDPSEPLEEGASFLSPETFFDPVKELREGGEITEAEESSASLNTGLDLLKSMLVELHRPNVHAYITLLVLRFASTVLSRGILFKTEEGEYVGLGEFGILGDKEKSAKLVRKIRIPREEPSILAQAEEKLFPLRISLDSAVRWNQRLIEMLGGEIPNEVFLGPIVCEGRLVGLFYGDNLPSNKPVQNTEAFEIFLSQAGIAMERSLSESQES